MNMLRCEKRGAPRSRGQFPVSPRPSILPPRGSWSCGQLSLPAPTRLLRRRPPGATVTVTVAGAPLSLGLSLWRA